MFIQMYVIIFFPLENNIDHKAFKLLTKSDFQSLITSVGKKVKILNHK